MRCRIQNHLLSATNSRNPTPNVQHGNLKTQMYEIINCDKETPQITGSTLEFKKHCTTVIKIMYNALEINVKKGKHFQNKKLNGNAVFFRNKKQINLN